MFRPFRLCCGSSESGGISGPESTVDSNLALWDGTDGSELKDSGISLSGLLVFYPSAFLTTAPTSNQVVLFVVAVGPVTLPINLAGSQGYANTLATAETDFDVTKNGTSVGTIRWAASTATPTFIAASPITLTAGDRLEVIAPSTPDTTFADFGFTLVGSRT